LEVLALENLGTFMTIWSILQPLEIYCGHLVYFVVLWYMYFPPFWYFGLATLFHILPNPSNGGECLNKQDGKKPESNYFWLFWAFLSDLNPNFFPDRAKKKCLNKRLFSTSNPSLSLPLSRSAPEVSVINLDLA
jgi:hypothetical protein